MATRLYSINRGQKKQSIIEAVGSATTGNLDVTWDMAAFPHRTGLINALKEIEEFILQGKFPPA